MFVAGFKPFSPSPFPQFLQVHHTYTCTHTCTHTLYIHILLPVYYPTIHVSNFPNLNNEQTPHSITSSQLVLRLSAVQSLQKYIFTTNVKLFTIVVHVKQRTQCTKLASKFTATNLMCQTSSYFARSTSC